MTITLDANIYTIQPAGYTLTESLGYPCAIAVSHLPDSDNMYILGDTFLRNFVAKFDFKRKSVSLAVNVNAPLGTAVEAHMSTFELTWIIIGSILGLATIGVAAWFYTRKRTVKKKRDVDPLIVQP